MKSQMGGGRAGLSLPTILSESRRREAETVRLLHHMVAHQSPSADKQAVEACMRVAAAACLKRGGTVRWHRQKNFGDVLEAHFGQHPKRRTGATQPLLLLGHLDTVWPVGTLKKMPFTIRSGRIAGPGVLDMKAGVAMALTALAILDENQAFQRPIVLLLNSDEEVGSPVSRSITEKIARGCKAVFVLEPGQGLGGAYKTARKGTGDFTVRVQGVAAHAGVDFSNGHSAVLELARQIEKIGKMTDLRRGLTVNPGVIGGGTLPNVVAAEAWARVDFRFVKAADAKKIERNFGALRPIDKRCRVEVEGGVNRPPMERTPGTALLFALAAESAAELGFPLEEASTGGGSDGNFTSAIGIPTLDGMGAVGEGAHAGTESILIEHLSPRTALLAAMLMKV